MMRRTASILASMALIATAVAQSVTSSNVTTSNPPFMLLAGSSMQDKIADLNPLTTTATNLTGHALTGALYLATPDTAPNITTNDVAFISCDQDAYPGNLQVNNVISTVFSNNATAIILYSTEAETCGIADDDSLNSTYIFAVTDMNSSQIVLNQFQSRITGRKFVIQITREATSQTNNSTSTNSDGNNNSNNPLGPSPSTAVAMIILYSITGVITTLFLVIIVAGAIRARRHPDRYGPRDGLGRPRQSRAKGLARAMLESIPIVKFGENEPPKPTDVELASHTDEPRNESQGDQQTTADEHNAHGDTAENAATTQTRNLPEGIAPAENAAASSGEGAASQALGCSICTDDFERGQDIRVLPCDHKFHPECVDPWLLNVSGTCPLCRIDLRPATSRTSMEDELTGEEERRSSNSIAPPLEDPENSVDQDPSSHMTGRDGNRRSRLATLFAPERLHAATAEERLSAARRLRDRSSRPAGNTSSGEPASGEESGGPEGSGEEVRRMRRLTMRLQDVFGIRTRRQGETEASPPTSETRE